MYLHISHFIHSDTILPCADEVMRNRNAESAGFPGRKRGPITAGIFYFLSPTSLL
jgi:hypothetical protein